MMYLFMVLACMSKGTAAQKAFCEAQCPKPVARVEAWEISGGVQCACIYRLPLIPRTEVE